MPTLITLSVLWFAICFLCFTVPGKAISSLLVLIWADGYCFSFICQLFHTKVYISRELFCLLTMGFYSFSERRLWTNSKMNMYFTNLFQLPLISPEGLRGASALFSLESWVTVCGHFYVSHFCWLSPQPVPIKLLPLLLHWYAPSTTTCEAGSR